MGLKYNIKQFIFRRIWHNHNKHNETIAKTIFDLNSVEVGKKTYGPLNVIQYDRNANLKIGCYCSIAENVTFLLGGEHDYKRISTYPFQSKVYYSKNNIKEWTNYNTIIDDDVWIGYGSLILTGVHIGKGSVIGANSTVTKDVPPYSIYAGNKVIKQRFDDAIINKLEKINYKNITHSQNDLYRKYVTTDLNETNIDEIINAFTTNN